MGRSRQTRRKGRSAAQKSALAKMQARQRQGTSSMGNTKREASPEAYLASSMQPTLEGKRIRFKGSSERFWNKRRKDAPFLTRSRDVRGRLIRSLQKQNRQLRAELLATQKLLESERQLLAKLESQVQQAAHLATILTSKEALYHEWNALACGYMPFASLKRTTTSRARIKALREALRLEPTKRGMRTPEGRAMVQCI